MTPEIKVTGRVLTYSPSMIARNRELLGAGGSSAAATQSADHASPSGHSDRPAHPSRIRQDPKPVLNQLEQDWYDRIKDQHPNYPPIRKQAKRYKIGNGAWYKADLTCSIWPVANGPARETAWECKGPKQMKNIARGILTLKTAATQWPEVRFVLVWRERGEWKEQEVLP